jgi:hypothetical protein
VYAGLVPPLVSNESVVCSENLFNDENIFKYEKLVLRTDRKDFGSRAEKPE